MQEKPALPQPQQKVVRGTGMHSDATYGVETAVYPISGHLSSRTGSCTIGLNKKYRELNIT